MVHVLQRSTLHAWRHICSGWQLSTVQLAPSFLLPMTAPTREPSHDQHPPWPPGQWTRPPRPAVHAPAEMPAPRERPQCCDAPGRRKREFRRALHDGIGSRIHLPIYSRTLRPPPPCLRPVTFPDPHRARQLPLEAAVMRDAIRIRDGSPLLTAPGMLHPPLMPGPRKTAAA